MKRIETEYGIEFIPFAEPDDPTEKLAGRGSIQIFDCKYAEQIDDSSRPWDWKISKRVKFNINLGTMTREEWQAFKSCVDAAFEELAACESVPLTADERAALTAPDVASL